jgi:uncharacterized protein (UPF0332 family)
MTQEQEALLTKARETLRATKLLAANHLLDSAASRAYYTMFHLAGALLLGKGLTFSKHGSLLGAFGLHLVKSGEVDAKFHRYLIDAQDNRIKGDYGVESNLTQAQVETMVAQAEEFLAMTEQLLGAAPPASSSGS